MRLFASKRWVALVLACLFAAMCCAAQAETVRVAVQADVYAAPDEGAARVSLPAGTQLERVAERDGWSMVTMAGNTGFMRSDALAQVSAEPQTASMPAYAKVNGAKVYSAPGKVIGTVPQNTEVTLKAVQNGVCLVERGGISAFMMLSELSPARVEVKQADNGITTVAPTTVYVKNDGAKVYNGSGKVIGRVGVNTALTMTAYNDQLALVANAGVQALMYRSDLSDHQVEVAQPDDGITAIAPTTFYVQNDGAKVYSAQGKVICGLPKNFALTVTAYNSTHALVSCGKNQGLVLRSDLSDHQEEEKKPDITEIAPTTFYVKNDGAKVLAADGTVMATLAANSAVTVNAYNDALARVVNGSMVGFMQKSDLTTEKASTPLVLQYGAQGEAVSKLQSRLKELGYFSGTVGGNYLDLTRAAVAAFQSTAKLTVSGTADETTLKLLFSDQAPKAQKADTSAPADGNSTVQAATGTAIEMDWWKSDIQSIFARGTVATVTDVQTGIAWQVKRSGGTNHADVQPLTAADTAAMKKAVGSWSWTRRAIFVTINGVNYAASMNCMPHGSGSITNNNFNGHHCIHFTNSRTHGSNKVCSLHQAAIKKAANTAL